MQWRVVLVAGLLLVTASAGGVDECPSVAIAANTTTPRSLLSPVDELAQDLESFGPSLPRLAAAGFDPVASLHILYDRILRCALGVYGLGGMLGMSVGGHESSFALLIERFRETLARLAMPSPVGEQAQNPAQLCASPTTDGLAQVLAKLCTPLMSIVAAPNAGLMELAAPLAEGLGMEAKVQLLELASDLLSRHIGVGLGAQEDPSFWLSWGRFEEFLETLGTEHALAASKWVLKMVLIFDEHVCSVEIFSYIGKYTQHLNALFVGQTLTWVPARRVPSVGQDQSIASGCTKRRLLALQQFISELEQLLSQKVFVVRFSLEGKRVFYLAKEPKEQLGAGLKKFFQEFGDPWATSRAKRRSARLYCQALNNLASRLCDSLQSLDKVEAPGPSKVAEAFPQLAFLFEEVSVEPLHRISSLTLQEVEHLDDSGLLLTLLDACKWLGGYIAWYHAFFNLASRIKDRCAIVGSRSGDDLSGLLLSLTRERLALALPGEQRDFLNLCKIDVMGAHVGIRDCEGQEWSAFSPVIGPASGFSWDFEACSRLPGWTLAGMVEKTRSDFVNDMISILQAADHEMKPRMAIVELMRGLLQDHQTSDPIGCFRVMDNMKQWVEKLVARCRDENQQDLSKELGPEGYLGLHKDLLKLITETCKSAKHARE